MLATRIAPALLLALALPFAASAQVGVQLYNGSWVAESFGNDLVGGTEESEFFSVFGMPQGLLCNAGNPVCKITSTPVSAVAGDFLAIGTICTPITKFGTPTRPAKGGTNAYRDRRRPKARLVLRRPALAHRPVALLRARRRHHRRRVPLRH